MARVKRGVTARRRHKKVLSRAKGYYGARSRVYRVAKQSVIKAEQYAYIGRKLKKRQFRSLWITRINAAARMFDLSYSRMINGLNKAGIEVDRKMLADLAVYDIRAFGAVADQARAALGMEESDKSNIVQAQVEARPTPKSKRVAKTEGEAESETKAAPKAKAEPKVKAKADKPAAKKTAVKKPATKASAKGDDLTKVEGIGPKIAELMHGANINSFADLAAADVEALKGILQDAGGAYVAHDPTTWPQQAKLAADGKFDELKELQDQLDGGRPAPDDLTTIEGIGPKIAELMQGADIKSFADLAAADVEVLKGVLADAGGAFAAHDPTTWPKQAKLAAAGKFDALKKLQDSLDGGRPA